MSDRQYQRAINTAKVALAFVNAFAGILAAYPGPELHPLFRLLAAATVAGCGAALLMLHPPGSDGDDDLTDEERAALKTQARTWREWQQARREAASLRAEQRP